MTASDWLGFLMAFSVSCFLAILDFMSRSRITPRLPPKLSIAVLLYVILNGAGAIACYFIIKRWAAGSIALSSFSLGILAGSTYMILANSKLTTLKMPDGESLAIGPAAVYEWIRDWVLQKTFLDYAARNYNLAKRLAENKSEQELSDVMKFVLSYSEASDPTRKEYIQATMKRLENATEGDRKAGLSRLIAEVGGETFSENLLRGQGPF